MRPLGWRGLREHEHEFGQVTMCQYALRNPASPNVRVIFTDYLTGWPDRLEGNDEEIVEVCEPMLQSFGLTEQSLREETQCRMSVQISF